MNNTNGFYLFIDLDDVLIDSHNDMNKDLVKAYGKEYDWANTVEAQDHFNKHRDELVAKHGERAQVALKKIQMIRDTWQKYGMSYQLMEDLFNAINSTENDDKYSEADNIEFHYLVDRMAKYFILKEKLLDARDTKLYKDNQITNGKHAVHYENYYTRERLLANPVDRDKPQVVEMLSRSNEFEGIIKILSHYNGPNEGIAKDAFCKDCYPSGEFMPLFFHENNTYDPYFRRPRYSKARFVSENAYDIRRSILIDDSMDNINTWINAGGIGILYNVKGDQKTNDRYYVIHDFTYAEIMNVVNQIKVNYQQDRGKILTK